VVHLQAEPDGFTAFHNACAKCPPHRAVVEWCVEHHNRGHVILIVTGRDAWSRELTEQWLTEHLPVPIAGLHMRGDDDYRPNVTIKREVHRTLARPMTFEQPSTTTRRSWSCGGTSASPLRWFSTGATCWCSTKTPTGRTNWPPGVAEIPARSSTVGVYP
jgi:hypothetical protein